MGLYTDNELVEKIKAIDLQLESAISKTEIDTSQTKNSVSISVRSLREQRERYESMLQAQNRALYNSIFGPSAIAFKGKYCGK
ncbi:MAG: hypothetical protein ACTSRG_13135 [Candidatus Helarchaeota archaeon]